MVRLHVTQCPWHSFHIAVEQGHALDPHGEAFLIYEAAGMLIPSSVLVLVMPIVSASIRLDTPLKIGLCVTYFDCFVPPAPRSPPLDPLEGASAEQAGYLSTVLKYEPEQNCSIQVSTRGSQRVRPIISFVACDPC